MVLASDYAELEAKCAAMTAKLSMINDLMEAAEQANKLAQEATETLVQERNALAAENAHARERHVFIRALAVSILEHSGGRMDWRGAMEDATELLQTVDSVYAKTPATDAFLAEIERKAIRKFINSIEHILRDKLSPYDTEEMLEAMRIFLEEQEGEQK
ncbi:hypothetical protein NOM21_000365 [Salmonella enterica]|nr:hypothetical protein [Salmonella enterica]